jgi:signal peptidase I
MKNINKLTEPALLIVVVLLILLTVLVNLAPHLGFFISDIGSGSMYPTLKVGAMVIGGRVNPDSLKAGDIIVYNPGENSRNNICHRIVEVLNTRPVSFRTRGDNNNLDDSIPVTAASVIGKVTFHMPAVGYLIQFLKSIIGLVLCLILPCVIIIVLCIRSIRRELKKILK